MDTSFQSFCQINSVNVKFQELNDFDIADIKIDDYLIGDEPSKFISYRQKKDAVTFFAGRKLIRTTLAKLLGINPKEVPIEISDHGKPFCPLKNAPQFSISHCENLLGLAWSKTPIGMDIESTNQAFAAEWGDAVINKLEEFAIQSMPEADRSCERIKLFTLKEAYLKMLGTGFMVDPKKVELVNNDPGIWEVQYPNLAEGKVALHTHSSSWIIAVAIPKQVSCKTF